MIILGLGECFAGLRMYRATLFIIGFLTGFGVLIAVLGEFVIDDSTSIGVIWVVFVICIFFGLLLGYFTTTLDKAGTFCLGFWLGTVLGFLLNNAFFYKLSETNTPLYILIISLGGTFGFLSFWLHKHVIIASTGFIGAYFIVRPFGFFAGNFFFFFFFQILKN